MSESGFGEKTKKETDYKRRRNGFRPQRQLSRLLVSTVCCEASQGIETKIKAITWS